jgi:predicted ABC-type transport system involved in lysophospholipase L1 biosynthesis ATPase subunit
MGPSGSGKTTLMDILAGRKNTGDIQGDIQFGGSKPSQAFLRRYTGYVEQGDTLIGSLTVFDMLMYTAELKRPREESREKKVAIAEALMKRLGLTSCAHVLIGDPMTKGISGGQAKVSGMCRVQASRLACPISQWQGCCPSLTICPCGYTSVCCAAREHKPCPYLLSAGVVPGRANQWAGLLQCE